MEIHIGATNIHQFEHVVCDFNGTIAIDGELLAGVKKRFQQLQDLGLKVWVITADTHGTAAQKLADYPCTLKVIGEAAQDMAKAEFIQNLNAAKVVAIGNGRNDRLMLKQAAVGIAVLQAEGCAIEALQAADILVKDINDALEFITKPLRLKATLRV